LGWVVNYTTARRIARLNGMRAGKPKPTTLFSTLARIFSRKRREP